MKTKASFLLKFAGCVSVQSRIEVTAGFVTVDHTKWLPILEALKYGKGVGPEADPGVQAVSPQMTISHPPGDRLPLLSARPEVTFPAAEHHRPLAGTELYLVTEDRGT